MREGMTENLKLAKQNIEFLKSNGAKLPNSTQAIEASADAVKPSVGAPAGPPPKAKTSQP